MPPVSPPMLSARGVVFEYAGPIRALDDLSLDFAAGELHVLLGPNGSGKSTLLKLCAGLLAPQRGDVRLGGVCVRSLPARERARRVALVPQYLPALPEVAVADFVLGGRYARLLRWNRVRPEDRASVEDALRRCDALELGGRSMAELSGGQRQRVLVARALAQDTELLLVDEPTNALDPEHQVRVFDLVAQAAAAGRCVVVATHDLNLASQYASRLALLDHGRVVAAGSVAEILRREVLEPVYGSRLAFGEALADGARWPFVLPRRGG